MILSDHSIRDLLKTKELEISDLSSSSIQSASVDLCLGSQFAILKYWEDMNILNFNSDPHYFKVETDEFVVPAKSFVLGTTKETIKLPPNITAFLEGRSSIGRMGLFIQNAGWVAPGFKGQIVLELFNANTMPIRLKANHRICQIVLCQMDQAPQSIYQGKYQNQTGVMGSKISKDIENKK
ncbi:MAG: dCTP deaminase [Bdellovibrionales bacterium]|nr:dCTP deaminase [Bdellovibrionales bacterium]